jgi:hypothetical protein
MKLSQREIDKITELLDEKIEMYDNMVWEADDNGNYGAMDRYRAMQVELIEIKVKLINQ